MDRGWFTTIIQVTAFTLILAAIGQELEKPKEERKWHGRVACVIPYDFRMPTIERIKETYWNPYDGRTFTPQLFGVGWAINFCALLEKIRVTVPDVSEESFLMPTNSIKKVLEPLAAQD